MTPFAGWHMPLRYGSETAEHTAVRESAGLFDLSHMGEIAVTGPDAGAALDYGLTGWLSRLAVGQARYTMICAPGGGIVDDLVVYRQAEERFLVVANAANTAEVASALRERSSGFTAQIADETAGTALIAIQGPQAAAVLSGLTPLPTDGMKYYTGCYAAVGGVAAWVARTGYTGEDGFEVYCAARDAERAWDALSTAGKAAGVRPAGLAARDTLRLEAGMPLYGHELGPDVNPFEAGLGRVVRLGKPGDFVGRDALAEIAASAAAGAGPARELIGLIARSRRIPRHGYPVLSDGAPVGTVTSGAPSPTLARPIAMAFVTRGATGPFCIDVRGQLEPADRTSLPFYKRSQQA
jgi:aminomethyltransferase